MPNPSASKSDWLDAMELSVLVVDAVLGVGGRVGNVGSTGAGSAVGNMGGPGHAGVCGVAGKPGDRGDATLEALLVAPAALDDRVRTKLRSAAMGDEAAKPDDERDGVAGLAAPALSGDRGKRGDRGDRGVRPTAAAAALDADAEAEAAAAAAAAEYRANCWGISYSRRTATRVIEKPFLERRDDTYSSAASRRAGS